MNEYTNKLFIMKTKPFYPKTVLNACARFFLCASMLTNTALANRLSTPLPSLLSRTHAALETGEAPYVDELWDQSFERNESVNFWVNITDAESPLEELIITVSSSNEGVIPSANVTYSFPYLTVATSSVLGESLITITATDPMGNATSRSFILSVVNYEPYAWIWPDYIDLQCMGDQVNEIYLEYGDYNVPASELAIAFSSSNEAILPTSQLNFEVADWGGVFYPQLNPGVGGLVEITATITDADGASAMRSFFINVPNDVNAPVITMTADTLTYVLEEGLCEVVPDWTEAVNVAEHETFGNDASYITNAHEGTFYAAANTTFVTEFGVDGNIGADGNGTVEHGMEVITSASGNVYHLYWQTQAAFWYDPGIHKMIFVDPLQDNITVLSDEFADDDTFILNGIAGESSLFYFLFGGRNNDSGTPHVFSPEERLQIAQSIANNVLDPARVANDESYSYNLESIDAMVASTVANLRDGVFNTPLFYEINMDYNNDGANNPVSIGDGGYDMYDNGNYIVTNFNNLYRAYDFWDWDTNGDPIGIAYTNGVVFYTEETVSEEATSQLVQITDDGCEVFYTSSHEAGQAFGPGMHTITYTATDVAGNESEASFVIHVIDEFEPTAIAENLDLNLSPGEVFEVVGAFIGGESFDNCEIVSYTTSVTELTCENIGLNEITLTVADAYGNTASTVFTAYVQCEIYGCMDPYACNFNPDANMDDANCVYNEIGYDCEGNCMGVPVNSDVYIENVWLVSVADCSENAESAVIGAIQPINGQFYNFIPLPGEFGGEGSYSFNECGVIFDGLLFMAWQDESSLFGSFDEFCYSMIPAVLGCTDELAANYNPEANFDDSSCEFITSPSNDTRDAAILVEQKRYPNCISIEGSLVDATVSEESFITAPEGCGEDVWYKFVAYSVNTRIDISSNGSDIALELQDEAGNNLVTFENVSDQESEIIILEGLEVGQMYYLAVRNWSESNDVSFNACFQLLTASGLANGPIYNGLCDRFRVENTSAEMYTVTISDEMSSMSSTATDFWVPLYTVDGIQHDHSYVVEVATTYVLEDAAGNPITIEVYNPELVEVYVNPLVDMDVREMDQCPRTKRMNSMIATSTLPCGVLGVQWEFTQVAEDNTPIAEPIYVHGPGRSRFFRVSNIPGVEAGNKYAVRIRVMYNTEEGGEWGEDYQYVCIHMDPQQVVILPGNNRMENEEMAQESLVIYPNPNNGALMNISLNGIVTDQLVMNVYDATGRWVTSRSFYDVEDSISAMIQFDRVLNDGVYMISFEYNNMIHTKRLVVSN